MALQPAATIAMASWRAKRSNHAGVREKFEALHTVGSKIVHTRYLLPGKLAKTNHQIEANKNKSRTKTQRKFSTFMYVPVDPSGDVS